MNREFELILVFFKLLLQCVGQMGNWMAMKSKNSDSNTAVSCRNKRRKSIMLRLSSRLSNRQTVKMATHFPLLVCVCSLTFCFSWYNCRLPMQKTVLLCLFLPLPSDPAGAFVASKPEAEQSQASKVIRQKEPSMHSQNKKEKFHCIRSLNCSLNPWLDNLWTRWKAGAEGGEQQHLFHYSNSRGLPSIIGLIN